MSWIKKGNFQTIEELFLANMDVDSLNDINDWFRKSFNHEYRLKNSDRAVKLIKKFKNKPIVIVGDYDVDGVTSTSILYMGLKWAGCRNVSYRIPKRFSEGFGVNKTIINEIPDDDTLVITCDNGVAQIEAINAAKERGMTVIIIDHHLPATDDDDCVIYPDADIIIDPNAINNSADFNGYCGAGLSYKVVCELLNYDKTLCAKMICLACLGTIADVMELKEENYVFVRQGLKYLLQPSICPTGVYALLTALNLTMHLTEHDVAFSVASCINAASRMNDDGAKDAVELCISTHPYLEARKMAERLVDTNKKRKEAQTKALDSALAIIERDNLLGEIPLVVYVPHEHEGVIGIVAGSLSEKYKVPAFVVTDTENGILKGSARGCGNYNIKEKLDSCRDYLLTYGGHEGAGGLSLRKSDFEEFKKALINNSNSFIYEEDSDNVYYDLEIKSEDVPKAIAMMAQYAPYGEGNPAPVFMVTDFNVLERYGESIKIMGPKKDSVKLSSIHCDAVGFGKADMFIKNNKPRNVSFIGCLSTNYFNNNATNQIEFQDCMIVS